MTKNEIMTRCRKVAIKIEGNRIFGEPEHPYQFITAFRTKELAENNLQENRSPNSNSLSNGA